jgi:hypothetical protein
LYLCVVQVTVAFADQQPTGFVQVRSPIGLDLPAPGRAPQV